MCLKQPERPLHLFLTKKNQHLNYKILTTTKERLHLLTDLHLVTIKETLCRVMNMKNSKNLENWLKKSTKPKQYLFLYADFRAFFPDISTAAFKTLLSRFVKSGLLERICKGIYAYKEHIPSDGFLLFHVAALMRSYQFNYISLETVLSESGIISQIPINRITIMSSGRSHILSCRKYGTIEFIHTHRKPKQLIESLHYDPLCKMWKASIKLAIEDMKNTHRDLNLIDWGVVNELI